MSNWKCGDLVQNEDTLYLFLDFFYYDDEDTMHHCYRIRENGCGLDEAFIKKETKDILLHHLELVSILYGEESGS